VISTLSQTLSPPDAQGGVESRRARCAFIWRLLPLAALVAAFAGLFAAAVLSIGHVLDLPVPCGTSRGCVSVALHPSSQFLGVPIAFFGIGAYLTIIFLLSRPATAFWARISLVAMAGAGTAVSAGLLIYAKTVIQATCAWCVASGMAMALLLVLCGALLKTRLPVREIKPVWFLALGLITAGAIGVQAGLMQRQANAPPVPAARLAQLTAADLVDPSKSLGPADAPVTIVMFGDLWCPACRTAFTALEKFQLANAATVRLAYRHLPLWRIRGHEFSRAAAALSEMAGEQRQFWPFIHAVHGQDQRLKREHYLELMAGLGFTAEEIDQRLNNPQDPAVGRVLRDERLAAQLGIDSTPSFLLLVDGQAPISANQRTLPILLNSAEVKSRRLPPQPRSAH
jgi:protein-disulfide isomerase